MPTTITWAPTGIGLLTVSKPGATVATISSNGSVDLNHPVYEVLSSTLPASVIVTVNNPTNITVSGNSLLALPPSAILYVVGTVLGSADSILDVPVDADPYKYTSNVNSQMVYTLGVKVTFEYVNSPGTYLSSSKTYEITVLNSWNADKAAIQSLMERYA